jgi:hypothetical protein
VAKKDPKFEQKSSSLEELEDTRMTGEGKELLETVINTLGEQIALQMELKFAITQRVLEMAQKNSETYGVSFWARPEDLDNPKAGVLLRATPHGFSVPKKATSILLNWTLQKHLEIWANYQLTGHDEEGYDWLWDC